MALELKLGLKLGQQLVMTPQLQQAIKLLQLSRMELENVVAEEMLENPILEESEQPMDEESRGELEEITAKDIQATEPQLVEGKPSDEFDWDSYMESYNSGNLPGPSAAGLNPDDLPSYENIITRSQTLSDHLIWQLKLSNLNQEKSNLVEQLIGNLGEDGYLKFRNSNGINSRKRFVQKNKSRAQTQASGNFQTPPFSSR